MEPRTLPPPGCSTGNNQLLSLSLTFLEEERVEGEELQEEAFETKTQRGAGRRMR